MCVLLYDANEVIAAVLSSGEGCFCICNFVVYLTAILVSVKNWAL